MERTVGTRRVLARTCQCYQLSVTQLRRCTALAVDGRVQDGDIFETVEKNSRIFDN